MKCLLVPDRLVWVFQKQLIYLEFHTQPSLVFTENGPKKRKYPVSGSCVDENNLLMSEVRGEWTDWLEMIISEFGVKNKKAWIHPALSQRFRMDGNGVMVWGIYSWHTLGLLVPIVHRLHATAYLLLLTMSISLWLQCTHLLMATSSRIMHHVTKLKSSPTGFLNMTMSSLYSNSLHSHQISIQ